MKSDLDDIVPVEDSLFLLACEMGTQQGYLHQGTLYAYDAMRVQTVTRRWVLVLWSQTRGAFRPRGWGAQFDRFARAAHAVGRLSCRDRAALLALLALEGDPEARVDMLDDFVRRGLHDPS